MLAEALLLVLLHTVDDREVFVNPTYVISTTEPKDKGGLASEVNCIVSFIDAKFISVKETCAEVNAILKRSPP
jgi:hypothetical protein